MNHMWTKQPVVLLLFLATGSTIHAQNTCEVDDQVYQRGEILNLETRCGSSDDFPCFCNPDVRGGVECPYCGFPQASGVLLCAGDQERVTYIDGDGQEQTCECSAPTGGTPTPDCNIDPNDHGNVGGGTCSIDLPDGTSFTFANGQVLTDLLPNNRCGSDYPCYCNPNAPGQIDCPYCRFMDNKGALLCARDRETLTFANIHGEFQTCSCQVENFEPTSNCAPSFPVQAPAIAPTPPLTPTDQANVCTLELEGGQTITFTDGESYGDHLATLCGSSTEFPCFCNPALSDQIHCPYCGFARGGGGLLCAKHGETVSFVDGNVDRTCSCEIPDDPTQDPIRTCNAGVPIPTSPPVPPPTTAGCTIFTDTGETVTIPNLESFGDLVQGICGSTQEWPAFCNTQSLFTGSIAFRQGSGNIEYPYCIFPNTQSGTPVCAKSNESGVTFVDSDGVMQRCNCLYLNPSLGGAQSTCRPVTEEGREDPTLLPNSAAAIGLTPLAFFRITVTSWMVLLAVVVSGFR